MADKRGNGLAELHIETGVTQTDLMLIFIDESGEPGLKIGSSSTEYFTGTFVAVEDNDEVLAAAQRIQQIKGELGFSLEFKFHYNSIMDEYRESFLSAVGGFA